MGDREMASKRTIVVVGGALSGPTAAAHARETDEHARILLIERAPSVSYAVGGLAQHLSGEARSIAELDREDAAWFRDTYDVEVRTGVEVTRIDAQARIVVAAGAPLAYDALIYASGAESVMPDVPGLAGAANVHRFRNIADLRAISVALRRGKRVAVLGGGFFGVEATDALTRRGTEVTLLEHGERILPAFAKGASHAAREALARAGAEVLTSARVVEVERKGERVRALRLADGRVVACDLVIVAIGVRPRSRLLGDAGGRLVAQGAVLVDASCRTTLPDVWACGSCVAVRQAASGRLAWMPQAAIADRTAQVAGASAAGGNASLRPALGTAIVRAGAITVARTGLGSDEPEDLEVARVHALSHDAFVPGAAQVAVELIFDRSDGTILGADVWGAAGVDKRIDVIATAIAGGLGVDDLAALDLAYAPPFSRARDVVNVAGNVASSILRGDPVAWAPSDLAARRERVTLVDVRSAAARKSGTLAGARALDYATLRASAAALARATRPLVFLSEDGARGYQAALVALARGARGAGYLSGGVASWRAEGLPISEIPVKTKAKAKAKAKRGAAR
jgi:NADPH-dependent 2,4-dienoyl-CoA reductase/sulfur reductase-like enzyme/rhodanese-related sulfurtransferase